MKPTEVQNEPSPESSPSPAPRRPLLLRLLGVRHRKGRLLRFVPTKWGWTLLVLLATAGGMLGFMHYSMQPEFCRSCHIMEPYFTAWHQSTHKDVACVKCHFEPGFANTLKGKWQASSQAIKYITGTYGSKPHAEIRDSSCLREECHAHRLLEGKVKWTVPRKRGGKITIRFDHTPHLKKLRRGKQLRCVSCHSQIVQGQHLVVTLDTCFLCHFKGLKHGRNEETLGGCKACHDAPKEKIRLSTGMFDHGAYLKRDVTCENCHADSVKGDGAVPKQVCWNCHNKPEQVARYPESKFIHDNHVTKHKVECSSCHVEIEHSLTAGAAFNPLAKPGGLDSQCAQCHEQTHAGPAEMYSGTGGRGVPDMPSPMYRTQVDCIGCHKARRRASEAAEVVGQTYITLQESCNYCHGTKYPGRLDEWKRNMATLLAKAEAAYKVSADASARKPLTGEDGLRVRRMLDDAAYNIRLVKLGHGVHNVIYATALLEFAMKQCKEVDRTLAIARADKGAGP